MDPVLISGISVAATAIVGALVAGIVKIMRARRLDRKIETTREDKRLQDCEERFAKLSEEIAKVREESNKARDAFQAILVSKVVESAQAMTIAAEVQREGNTLQREQTRVLERVCRHLEAVTPPRGNPTTEPAK